MLDIDGEFGPETRRAARQVAHGLGLAAADYEHGITPAVRKMIQKPTLRTATQKMLGQRAAFRKKLRADTTRTLVSGAHGPLQAKAYAEARSSSASWRGLEQQPRPQGGGRSSTSPGPGSVDGAWTS